MFATWTLVRRCRWAVVLSAMLVACGVGQRLNADLPAVGDDVVTVKIGSDVLRVEALSPRIIQVTFLHGAE